MRQLQTVIDADKRHQRAMRSALSEQAAKLDEQHTQALQQAQQAVAAAQAAAVAALEQQLGRSQQRADAAEQAASDAQRRAAEAEVAAAAAQRRAAAAEQAAEEAAAAHANPDSSGSDMLRLQLDGTQDQLAETQQRLREAEHRHAAEAAVLHSQLAAAQKQQREQAEGGAQRFSSDGKDATDEAAVAAAVQQRQQALGSEFEQALQRQQQQLLAQHAAEITSLEQVHHCVGKLFLVAADRVFTTTFIISFRSSANQDASDCGDVLSTGLHNAGLCGGCGRHAGEIRCGDAAGAGRSLRAAAGATLNCGGGTVQDVRGADQSLLGVRWSLIDLTICDPVFVAAMSRDRKGPKLTHVDLAVDETGN